LMARGGGRAGGGEGRGGGVAVVAVYLHAAAADPEAPLPRNGDGGLRRRHEERGEGKGNGRRKGIIKCRNKYLCPSPDLPSLPIPPPLLPLENGRLSSPDEASFRPRPRLSSSKTFLPLRLNSYFPARPIFLSFGESLYIGSERLHPSIYPFLRKNPLSADRLPLSSPLSFAEIWK